MEDGVLTDGKGRSIDFKNAILVMTSNVGSRRILELVAKQRMARAGAAGSGERRKKKKRRTGEESSFEDFVMGEGPNGDGADDFQPNGTPHPPLATSAEEYGALSEVVQEELQASMRPELLNRIDDIIVFSPLRDVDLRDIAHAIVDASVERALVEKNVRLTASEALIDAILDDGASNAAAFGARPMRRASRRLFEDAASEAIVRGFLREGDGAVLDVGGPAAEARDDAREGTLSGTPTVRVVRERDGEVLVVDVDDGSGGIGAARGNVGAKSVGRDELQPDML
ncbi:hypothetical protein ACHAWF_017691 [Thalassiosira exigua]